MPVLRLKCRNIFKGLLCFGSEESMENSSNSALFAGAHPDDIEFMMAGTLLLLRDVGYEVHMWNLADGCYGGFGSCDENASVRWSEAKKSASIVGAHLYPPVSSDLSIFYGKELIAKACSIVREVKPRFIFLPAPDDYMEDHVNTSRILVTGAFARGMRAFESDPPRDAWEGSVTIYHALPYGLRDQLGRFVRASHYVDISSILEKKKEMLACHKSQNKWVSFSQLKTSSIEFMEEISQIVGRMSSIFRSAEGWRRHSSIGFCREEDDPLLEVLGEKCFIDKDYERWLRGEL